MKSCLELIKNKIVIIGSNNNFTNIISGYYQIKMNYELVFEITIYIKKQYIYSDYDQN